MVCQESFKDAWSFKGGLRRFQGCYKEDLSVFPKSFTEVWRVFQGSFKSVSKKFQGNFKGVSRKFQVCFNAIWKKFQWCFNPVSKVFQGCFKEVSKKLQGSSGYMIWGHSCMFYKRTPLSINQKPKNIYTHTDKRQTVGIQKSDIYRARLPSLKMTLPDFFFM